MASALAIFAAPTPAQPSRLSLERLTAFPALTGVAPSSPVWSPDSRTLAFLWNDRGETARELWTIRRDGAGLTKRAEAGSGIAALHWAPDASELYYLRDRDIWRLPMSGPNAMPARLTHDGVPKSALSVSPDGAHVAWLAVGDLWMMPVTGGTSVRLTSMAVAPIGQVPLGTYYRYDAEVGTATWGGSAPAYTWAPDGRRIALHFTDRRQVRRVGIPYYLGDSVVMNVLRRSYPGDPNESRRVGILDVSTRGIRWLPFDAPDAVRVVGFAWSPTGALLVDRESDDAVDRWVHVLAPGDTLPRLVWTDHRATRIYNDIASGWHPDGRRILLTGDIEDRYRLYALDPADQRPVPLSPASEDVSGHGLPAGRDVIYVSNAPSPYERHVWRVPGGGGVPTRLTTDPGHHAPIVSPDGSRLAVLSSSDVSPVDLYIGDAARPGPLQRVTRSPTLEFSAIPWQRARYVSFPHATDSRFTLHARIIEPPNLDRSRRYPVLIGPAYSNTVRNRWGGLYGMVQQLLAIEHGYIVVQVDVRGSTGYGRDFREAFLMDWGGRDLDDLESTVQYLKTLPWVDPNRFGLWGSSYGGTLAVYALLRKPGLFQAAVAGAPATDPRFFGSDDVAIARRPATHPETFARGAAQYAANLRDPLLIIHGMQDDVVPFKTTMDLAEALMRAGRDFDMAIAPAATHGWTQRPHEARYLLKQLIDHFDRHLGGGPR